MKIWYDALTGKHMRYGIAVAEELRRIGNEVTVTTRRHPDSLGLADLLNESVVPVGKYDPKSLFTRLLQGTRRQLVFCRMLKKDMPDLAVSHGSVDQCRVAFGLGIPIVTTLDTPYAEAVHRLTLPLSDFIVTSKSIPNKIIRAYCVGGEIVNFNGVDECAWIQDFIPTVEYDFGRPLIVVRQFEAKATYARQETDLTSLARKLSGWGKVVFLARYSRRKIKGLVVPKGFVDSASLLGRADLFVGAGGTMTREAAMQGTPAIIVETGLEQHVNNYLIQKKFPIFKAKMAEIPELSERLVGTKFEVKKTLAQLENPVRAIADIVSKMAGRVRS